MLFILGSNTDPLLRIPSSMTLKTIVLLFFDHGRTAVNKCKLMHLYSSMYIGFLLCLHSGVEGCIFIVFSGVALGSSLKELTERSVSFVAL